MSIKEGMFFYKEAELLSVPLPALPLTWFSGGNNL